MEYVKPTTKISRAQIATRLLAGSGTSFSITEGQNVNMGGSANTGSEQAGGGFMLAKGRSTID
ncbi:MAG: hypothetical protein K6E54_07010 [Bacteroidaceae bacterium]|nr:hypothetical protein [Bacteroidaceae bacterium]